MRENLTRARSERGNSSSKALRVGVLACAGFLAAALQVGAASAAAPEDSELAAGVASPVALGA